MNVSRIDWDDLENFVSSKVAHCVDINELSRPGVDYDIPGCVLLVSRGGEVLLRKAYGSRRVVQQSVSAMLEETVFDLGTLTGSLITSSLAIKLVDRGLLETNRKISQIFQTFGVLGKDRMTIRHLLSHCSGFPRKMPFYRRIAQANSDERLGMMFSSGATDEVYNEIFRSKLDHLPGKHVEESEVGFILLGRAIEVLGGMPLDKQAAKILFAPNEMRSSGFIRNASLKRQKLEPVSEIIAPSGYCEWREREVCGEVWDENTWAMGGVSGNAGLFSTVDDVNALCVELLECWHGRGSFVNRELIRSYWKPSDESAWSLGWSSPHQNAGCGKYFSKSSVGRDSDNGSSVWIDPERELVVTLLCNAGHFEGGLSRMNNLRPKVHDLVIESLGLC